MYLLRSLPRGKIPGASFIPGSREAIESAVRGIMKTYAKYPAYVVKYNEWLAKMPLSDDVHEHIRSRGLFVPFEKLLFRDNIDRFFNNAAIVMGETISQNRNECNLLPTVITTDAVQWSGRDNDSSKPAASARLDIKTGLPAQDCRPNAASKRADERKRKRNEISNQTSHICEGDVIFINLSAWPEYEDEWPYDSPIATTYVKGVYGIKVSARGKGKQIKRKLSVPAFNRDYTVDRDWIENYGLVFELPVEGVLYITANSKSLR